MSRVRAADPNSVAERIDARAKKILFDAHWTSKGWIDRRDRGAIPAADRAHAITHRMMFEPFTGSHDDVVRRTTTAVAALALDHVTGAFLASLSSRRLDLRSGLASYLIAFEDEPHRYEPGDRSCSVCGTHETYAGEDLDVLSFERHKWGGVRHHSPLYRMLDLEQLALEPPLVPTKQDVAIMRAILDAIVSSPAKDTPSKLSARLAGVLRSTKDERNTLVDLLAASFVIVAAKQRNGAGEWSWAGEWRGEDGIAAKQVRALFGMHGVKAPASKKR